MEALRKTIRIVAWNPRERIIDKAMIQPIVRTMTK